MSSSFRAAVLVQHNEPLEIMDLYLPAELSPGQVVVNFETASICGAQINEITGAKGPDKYLPHLLGHEGAGVVARIGPGVRHVRPGDHVVAHWRRGSGIDAKPPIYMRASDLMPVGGGWITTFNEKAVISENRLTVISDGIPMDIAALMGCAVTTGLGIVINEAKVRAGQDVMVVGVGGVGMSAVIGAHLVGAREIAAVDQSDEKIRLAYTLGATVCGNMDTDPHMWDDAQFDVVIECTGNPEMINWALQRTAPRGTLVLVGQPRFGQDVVFSDFRQHYFGKTVLDSQGGGTIPELDIPRYIGLWQGGRLPLGRLITDECDLVDINDAIRDMMDGKVLGRALVKM